MECGFFVPISEGWDVMTIASALNPTDAMSSHPYP